MRRLLLIIFILLLLVIGGGLGYGMYSNKLESDAPEFTMGKDISQLGRSTKIAASFSDNATGLREAKISVVQNHKQITLWEQKWPANNDGQGAVNVHEILLNLNAQELGLVQGPAVVMVEARDNSWRRWMRGNHLVEEIPVQVVLVPPRVSVLSKNIYINRGGVGVLVYRVNESVVKSGVKIDNEYYPGFAAWPDNPPLRICYFAYPDTLKQNTLVELIGEDSGNNTTHATLPVKVRWRDFKSDNIALSDSFLSTVAQRFSQIIPPDKTGSDLDAFVWVNEEYRNQSSEMIKQATSYSEPHQLWRGAFLRPIGKVMSNFIEKRLYTYQGKGVSTSTHYGLDLADVANTTIKASADGRVVFAQDAGIYGNCIVIDHGLNLFTLYAHLSSMEVNVGDNVTMGQRIGLSGSTGFSFGDHLHFSCMIGNTYVTPYEWWDSHWINDNVELQYQDAGVSAPN